MALFDTTWYVSSVGWAAVTAWAAGAAKTAGSMVRQTAPAVAAERVFIALDPGTTHATTEPTWTNTRGAKNTDNDITWQEITGAACVNGDVTNTPASSSVRSQAITLGATIKNNAATHYFICSTAGTAAAGEPTYDTTAGNTTADGTATWTCIGAVGNFTGGQAPHARLENALTTTWAAVGNTIFVKSDHAQTAAAAVNINGAGTPANPNKIFCHNGAAYPPLSANLTTGGTITSTGNNTVQIGASAGTGLYIRGLTFECGTGANNLNFALQAAGAPGLLVLDNCALRMVATGSSGRINIGQSGSASLVKFLNTTVKFGAVGQNINTLSGSGVLEWRGGGLESGSAVPTALFGGSASAGNTRLTALIEGVDLSAITSGNALVFQAAAGSSRYVFKDCKLASGVVAYNLSGSTNPGPSGPVVDLIRCDHAAANTRSERHNYLGSETTETTIVRTGGASDGTTSHARKIVTSANALFVDPFESLPISVWNEDTGSAKTLTVYGIWGGGAVPDNDDIWIEVEYLGSSATPVGGTVSSAKADPLATAASYSSDGSTWGGSTTAFKMSVTFTPQMKGPITVYVRAGLASSTFYYDPKVEIV